MSIPETRSEMLMPRERYEGPSTAEEAPKDTYAEFCGNLNCFA